MFKRENSELVNVCCQCEDEIVCFSSIVEELNKVLVGVKQCVYISSDVKFKLCESVKEIEELKKEVE